ncbi:MAG: hypothetical protein AC479_07640 [miscellaneous Crenarchaeota group-6 archaeon AD8-1]|nr:MAG: hypothetical protein AC479_07640 [miscellaneous Crenarchaeota group-6 archaeon AD8-1]
MSLKNILGTILVIIIFFFGIIFAFASAYSSLRLIVAGLLFVLGFGIIFYLNRRPKVTIQKLELSGEMKAVAINCPNCSASIKPDRIKIISGVPYATCPYCDNTFEITEEPKW